MLDEYGRMTPVLSNTQRMWESLIMSASKFNYRNVIEISELSIFLNRNCGTSGLSTVMSSYAQTHLLQDTRGKVQQCFVHVHGPLTIVCSEYGEEWLMYCLAWNKQAFKWKTIETVQHKSALHFHSIPVPFPLFRILFLFPLYSFIIYWKKEWNGWKCKVFLDTWMYGMHIAIHGKCSLQLNL